MKLLPFIMKAVAALLCILLFVPAASAAAEARSTAAASIMNQSSSPLASLLTKTQSRTEAPNALKSFAKGIIQELSQQDLFQNWSKASIHYDTLGPDSGSWLVTLSQNNNQLGYLIFSAQHNNRYMLSEYGLQSSAPFDVELLRQRLASEGLLSSASAKLPGDLQIEALYSPLLPVWKVTPKGRKPVYISAMSAEALPLTGSDLGNISAEFGSTMGVVTSDKSKLRSFSTSVQHEAGADPYDNLLWLTAPRLPLANDAEVFHALQTAKKQLVFTSPSRNAAYGAPFAVTGMQTWSGAQNDGSETFYAATGKEGTRYLPVSMLRSHGEFRILTSNP